MTAEGLFSIFPSLPWEEASATPTKPDSVLAGGHWVSNFEMGLLQNIQFQALGPIAYILSKLPGGVRFI